ncbi:phosphoenolpyruvate--protein phosphotransferase [Allostreptomyces psammosilenae]|uniref:Phosphoenolpyruvate-protein phosphotransferase n=1 Tax=Allostreptomyces psammosilenae TaxID=1892865 RepID=A0A852ZTI7_9ACTN|nr:phosphoenolpyruvate--protein phosphotransferase [Allostreptomyces psammosilenae]NYI05649.1 phosphotransferase system enzyme I (PtsI) [Allostreptomyces psammosilenae]
MPRTLSGVGVSPGTVVGPVAKAAPPPALPEQLPPPGDPAAETAAIEAALRAVADDLQGRIAQAAGPAADILLAQVEIVRDPALVEKAGEYLTAGRPAPHAVHAAFNEFRELLAAVGGYLGERAADLDDLRNRAVAHLLGLPMPGLPRPGHPYVLLAEDLAPADTATLDPAEVLAIVTEQGGPTSHTAILAKALGVPAVVACAGVLDLADGETVVVDGVSGAVEVAPEAATVDAVRDAEARRRSAAAAHTGPGRTADGHAVKLLVNVGAARGLQAAADADSEGVGLFRTEFLFLDRAGEPDHAEQVAAYRAVFEAFAGRRVVVRTLDAGADKPLGFVTVPGEANPALGVRGLRTARRHPGLLDRQLAALAEAARATGADVWVMAPMVSLPAEAADFAARVREAGLPTAGAMLEVPAAALRAGALASACDFLSVGTNDLAQYVMAADRMNGELADLLDPWQPAVLELLRQAATAARAEDRPVGVCGESASDPAMALVLAGLGVTSLSMAPVCLPEVRAALRRHTLAECQDLAARALAAPDAATAHAEVQAAARWE